MGKTKFTRIICLTLAFLFLVSGAAVVVSADTTTGNVTEKSIEDYIDGLKTISYDEYLARNKQFFDAAGVCIGDREKIVFDATTAWDFYSNGMDAFGNGKGTHVAPNASGTWTLTATDGTSYDAAGAEQAGFNKNNLAYVSEYEGVNALYTPNVGSVTWTLNLGEKGITAPALYSIGIKYYPVAGKSASIEREFYINYEAPFTEARSVTFAKNWSSFLKTGDQIGALAAIYTPSKKILKDASKTAAKLAEVKAAGESAGLSCTVSEDGKSLIVEQPKVLTKAVNDFMDEYDIRFFETDDDRNELRPTMTQDPKWMTFSMRDSGGYYSEDFGFVLTPSADGTVTFTLKGVNECMAISEIFLTPYSLTPSYDEYMEDIRRELGTEPAEGTDKVKIEAEYTAHTSTNVVYPIEDRASALTSPADTTRVMLNTIGTEKWETAGQWVEYKFSVNASGMYEVFSRFKQSYLDGMFVSRSLRVFTNYATEADYRAAHNGSSAGYYNGIPFTQAENLRYDYSSGWQVTALSDDGETTYPLYLEKDVEYTFRIEVTLGTMSDIVLDIEAILNALNADYLEIIKLTGTSPDDYRDYSFSTLLPGTLIDMIRQSQALTALSKELKQNTASTYTGICDKLANLLDDMGHDEDSIAKNLSNFKSYVGSLGTFLSDAKTQPLQLDFLTVQGASAKAPKAKPNFIQSTIHELSSFIQSFFRDYNNMGAKAADNATSESAEVWLAYGRDQAQVIRNLCTNDFTTGTGIAVDLKLVSGGTLLPSILAGMGPDAYLGLGQADVINYAIRGALMNIEDMAGYDDLVGNFNEAAMMVLQMDDADGVMHCYGLPETQGFPMMFVRIDILAKYGIEIPKTWEDLYIAQSKLESNNMEIGVPNNYKIHLYQKGGELFADDGMRINLDSIVGLDAFETMCNMFTQYSFPYSYDAANRFRTGEMPIIIADYTSLYNQLKVFATEIEGSWSFVPLPGYTQANGTINNSSVSTVTAAVIIKTDDVIRANYDSDEEYQAALKKVYGNTWEFVKWYTDAPCQIEYANEMVAIIGDSAKHSTANFAALEEMPWTEAERTEVEKQFQNLASIPNYPGYYILDRYTNFAFLDAYNNDADPSTELLSYINTINKEITRKREEFKLETLEIGQTLAKKRTDQANTALALLMEKYNADGKYKDAYDVAKYGLTNQKISQLREAALAFAQNLNDADGTASACFNTRLNGTAKDAEKAVETLKAQSWFVFVNKQTAEAKNGGYKIDSLDEKQLNFFVAECLLNAADALESYQYE